MNSKTRRFLVAGMAAVVAFAVGAGLLLRQPDLPGLADLPDVLMMPVPTAAVLVDSKSDAGFFEATRTWLIEIPAGQEPVWKPEPSRFRECVHSTDRTSDYAEILRMIQEQFPARMSQFQQPRIWRGGKAGNCYAAMSDDGRLIWFCHFAT